MVERRGTTGPANDTYMMQILIAFGGPTARSS
jgi:hypothetical protein